MIFLTSKGSTVKLDTTQFVGGSGLLDDTTDDVQKALTAINLALDYASSTYAGVMSSEDKIKLDSINATYLSTLTGNVQTQLNLKSPLNNPAFTGIPTAPTASVGTNSNQIATTAFVLANAGTGGGTTTLTDIECGSAGTEDLTIMDLGTASTI